MDRGRGVPKAAVALVVVGGIVWVVAGIAYGSLVLSCMSCASVVVAAGVDTTGFSDGAIRVMAWDALYANVYVVAVGLLAIVVTLTGFRRGERWGWLGVAIFVGAAIVTAVVDQLAWGGWYTFLFLGLLPLIGLLWATPAIIRRPR